MLHRISLAIVFFFLLTSCGGGDLSSPVSTQNHRGGSSNNQTGDSTTLNNNFSTAKSNDPHLEEFVDQIHSDKYESYLIVQIDDVKGIYVVNNRPAARGGRGAVGVATINEAIDKVGGSISVSGHFNDRFEMEDNKAKQLEKLTGRSFRSLGTFLRLNVTDRGKAEELLRELWQGQGIRAVYPATTLILTVDEPTVPDLTGQQGYLLGRGDRGLNVNAAHERGVKGRGVEIWDMEGAWNLDHVELRDLGRSGRSSGESDAIAHGTAVLGILAGTDDNVGVRGIAPQASAVPSLGGWDVANGAVNGLYDDLVSGDIILFEFGPIGRNPLEIMPDAFAAFERVTAEGVLVVDGAGNGGRNLNQDSIYFPGSVDIRVQDSGAITVGASDVNHLGRLPQTNCGSPIDMHAWGSGVVTSSYPSEWYWYGTDNPGVNQEGPDRANRFYTNAFGGTSAAAAMIAGVAALLQSHAKAEMGSTRYVTPERVRQLLQDSGIPAVGDGDCSIGRQPDIAVALDLFDDFWRGVQAEYPELARGEEVRGERRRALRERGVGLICRLYDVEREASDPSCPESARCVLEEGARSGIGAWDWEYELDERRPEGFSFGGECSNIRCLPLDVDASDYDCVAGAIWPAGLREGKALDFDGDLRADLVNWTETRWQIDLSGNELGDWDIELSVPRIAARWQWPVVEDYDRDGRADLAVYDKENGRWHIQFTDASVLDGQWRGWDWEVGHPYRDELRMNVRETSYGRPVPGDYDGDGYIDLALARSDGVWSIDYGGPMRENYGTFDENITYLTPAQLAQAPGWAYLPFAKYLDGISYKVPDGLTDEGEIFVYLDGELINFNERYDDIFPFGGNNSIPLGVNGHSIGIKSNDGTWRVTNDLVLESLLPDHIYGGLDCHPFVADFDGDGFDDRAVQCPSEFRIGLSDTQELLTVPLGYDTRQFSLPGKPFFGGVSYATTQRLIDWQRRSFPGRPPIIPVDMVQGGFCRRAGETCE